MLELFFYFETLEQCTNAMLSIDHELVISNLDIRRADIEFDIHILDDSDDKYSCIVGIDKQIDNIETLHERFTELFPEKYDGWSQNVEN